MPDYRTDSSNKLGQTLGLIERGIEAALELSSAGVWEVDLSNSTYAFSSGYFELLGVDPSQGRLHPDFWHSRAHPDDAQRVADAFANYVRGEAPEFDEVYRLRHEDGRWLWVLVRGRRIAPTVQDPHERVMGYIVDIDERHTDHDRLRASEERFRFALSAIPGVIYDLDIRSGKVERHGFERIFDLDWARDIDSFGKWLGLVHPEDRERVVTMVNAGRLAKRNYEMHYRVQHKDGRTLHVWHRATYMLGPDGEILRAFGIIEDVTENRRQQHQLRMQASIIERMHEGVMLLDSNAQILFTNSAIDRIFGYGPGELVGLNAHILSLRSKEAFDGLAQSILRGVEGERSSVVDLEGRCRDGTPCPLQCQFSSMQFGEQRCVIGVMSDASDRKQLERELMQATTRVQQRIGGDLHDGLGQQLTGIAMMLKGLVQRAEKTGSDALRVEIEGIVGLVNAAIQSTRTLARGLSPVSADREGFLEGFAELGDQILERYGVRVQLDLQLPAELHLDENMASHLYRIAQEGVTNAARHAGADRVQLQLTIAGQDVEMLIVDNGRGFDPAQVSHGGMGLRVMRFRAQMIGGYLAVETRPGDGTTLRCRAPLKSDRVAA